MRTRFSHIRDLLKTSEAARPLLDQAHRDSQIRDAVRESLPATLRPHLADAIINGATVTILFDSPAWQTKGRFFADRIVASLKSRGVEHANFRTRPKSGAGTLASPAPLKEPRLSSRVVAHLYEAADHQSDPQLSEAIRRIARHHDQSAPTEAT